jgi:hypothetical protein
MEEREGGEKPSPPPPAGAEPSMQRALGPYPRSGSGDGADWNQAVGTLHGVGWWGGADRKWPPRMLRQVNPSSSSRRVPIKSPGGAPATTISSRPLPPSHLPLQEVGGWVGVRLRTREVLGVLREGEKEKRKELGRGGTLSG